MTKHQEIKRVKEKRDKISGENSVADSELTQKEMWISMNQPKVPNNVP
jgi:hypothetical protein